MAHSSSIPLNPEPSHPEVRQEHNLPPKTYAQAADEDYEADFGGPSPAQFSGQGEDDAPRSPVRKPQKKNTLLRVNGHKVDGSRPDDDYLATEKHSPNHEEELQQNKANHQEESKQDKQDKRDKRDKRKRRHSERNDNDRELVSGRQAGRGWELSGIRFAPLNVPLKRRLQTSVVLFHTVCIALLLSTFLFLCAIPILWPLLFPYVIWLLFSSEGYSGTLRRRSNFLRSLPVWSLFASYFPARLHRSQELAPTRKYIFGYHPHGIISHGAFAAFATEALGFSQLFPGITNTLLTLDSNFRIPLYRDYALAMGLASVSRTSIENILSRGGQNGEGMGRAVTIVVGGARESLDAAPNTLKLVLKRRKGFVKLAIRTGADLVPVLAFGENELYDQVSANSHPKVHKVQLVLKKLLGFTIPLFHARGVFNYDVGLMPYRRPINVVVGRPIKVVQTRQPDETYVSEVHAEYVAELERMWEEWKGEFAKDMTGELEIVE